MNVLILNAFNKNPKGKEKFENFSSLVQDLLKKVSHNSGIGEIEFTLKDIDNIDEFLYTADYAGAEGKINITGKKAFEKLDFIFIDGGERYMPWIGNGYKLTTFLKLCKKSNKVVYAGGVAMEILVYFLATDYFTDMNIINSNGEVQSIEEIHRISKAFLSNLKRNDYFLDYVTGDVYEYTHGASEWLPIMNIGLHKLQTAEKYIDRGKYVLNLGGRLYRPKSVSSSASELIACVHNEIKVRIQKQYLSHWLVKDLPLEFVAYTTLTWFSHNFCVKNPNLQFKSICESTKGSIVIEHENSVGVSFHAQKKYKESALILENFINFKFNMYKDKLFEYKSSKNYKMLSEYEHKIEPEKNVPLIFKHFAKPEQNDSKDTSAHFGQRPLSSMVMVNSSRPFSNIKKVKQFADHVGLSFNNRHMIFVENNAVSSRPVSSYKNYNFFSLHLPNNTRESQELRREENSNSNSKTNSNLKTVSQQLAISSGSNERMKKLFEIQNTSSLKQNIKFETLDTLKKEIDKNDKNNEDYIAFVDKNLMDEDQMINYYRKKRREICERLAELSRPQERRVNKLTKESLVRKSPYLRKEPRDRPQSPVRVPPPKEATNDGDNESMFAVVFPYVHEDDLIPVVRKSSEKKEVVHMNLMTKSSNNFNSKFKKYDNELNKIKNPVNSCASEYLTLDQIRRREFLESKKKWVRKEDFKRFFGKNTTNLKFIPNIISCSGSNSPLSHKFRDVVKSKWVSRQNFLP